MSDVITVEFKKKYPAADKVLPFILMAAVIILDQLSKLIVSNEIPVNTAGLSMFDGFFRIIHVSNPGIAFSFGAGLPVAARKILFNAVPLIVLISVVIVYIKSDGFSKLQRWAIMGIVGGGLGNLIDRFFRAEGVIDFLDFKWFHIENSPVKFLRWDRWPTFNLADAAIVVCGILLLCSFLFSLKKNDDSGENI